MSSATRIDMRPGEAWVTPPVWLGCCVQHEATTVAHEEKHLKFHISAIAAAVLIASGLLQSVQAAVPAAGQSKVSNAPLVDMGVADPAAVQSISITLPLRNAAALDAFIASTVDPTSANFRQFITPAQFADSYGAASETVAQVVAFLRANGIAVSDVAANRLLISASASNAQLSALFGTQIHNYSQGGVVFQRPVGNVVLPLGLQGVATGVTGLSTQPLHHSNMKAVPRAGTLATEPDFQPQPVSTSVITTGIPGQLTAADVLRTYNGLQLPARGLDGSGTTLGIMTFAGFSQSDAYAYWNLISQPVLANRITEVKVGNADPKPTDNGADETALDVEQSGGIAPQAKIRVYEAPNTAVGALQLYSAAITENLCDTLSVSWGEAEVFESGPDLAFYDAILKQAAAQGTPVTAAAGDAGAYDINRSTYLYPQFTPILTVDFPASHPLVLAAGGTTLPASIKRKYGVVTVPTERAWAWDYFKDYYLAHYGQAVYYSNAFPVGGGGGVSVDYGRPSYQSVIVGVKSSSAGQSMFGPGNYNPTTRTFSGPIIDYVDMPANFAGRNVPDVSLNADPYTGYYLVFGGQLSAQGGGTSFVAPQLNGVFALITQQAGRRLGLLHPQLYGAYKAKGYGADSPFRAIAAGTDLYYQATNSYNPAVGLGVLNIDNLSKVLAPLPQ